MLGRTPNILRVGNAQGFWGDWPEAPLRLAQQAPELDVLTLDYLAEVSMSIMARQRQRDPSAGYARDFIEVIESLIPFWRNGRKLRVISNAGGLNPPACAHACADLLRKSGCTGLKIATVSGDDVLDVIKKENREARSEKREVNSSASSGYAADSSFIPHPSSFPFAHLETGQAISTVAEHLITANAYLGAGALVDALAAGADIVITGRVADPSLTVAPALAHFGWPLDDYARIAGATIAGHLIECGAQVTGGISTDWLSLSDLANIGYPIAEIAPDGTCAITKPPGTGGRVNEQIVKEQLVYEIGDPDNYLSPDATVSFLSLRVEDLGNNRVRVSGATGRRPSEYYKVSVTYHAGYRASGTLTLFGRDAVLKAQRCAQIVHERLAMAGRAPKEFRAEIMGAGALDPTRIPEAVFTGSEPAASQASSAPKHNEGAREVVLRLSAADDREAIVERFSRMLAPLVTTGPQGITGYAEGRPPVRPVIGYWPTLVPRNLVQPRFEMMSTG